VCGSARAGAVVVGKNVMCCCVSWQACWSPGVRVDGREFVLRYAFLPASLATMTSSTGQSAGRRRERSRSASCCRSTGTNLSWLGSKCTMMSKFGCESIALVLHGESSHACKIRMQRKGVCVFVELVKACKTAFRISAGSYSGLVIHEPDHR
jgi:hypothetical protein